MSDIEKVKKLRELTGAGFKDCNLAIKESDGDIDKAIGILRVKGISKASKKMSRDAKEGVVAVSGDENKTSVIEVNCETDFVAKNEDFTNFVKELSDLNNEKNSNLEDLKSSKMKNGETVEDNIVSLIAKIGEKITIGKAKTIEHAGTVNNHYLHPVVKDNISKYQLNIDITSKALKNKFIEVNTTLKFEDKEPNEKKSYYEIVYATIIKVEDDVKEKKDLERIILCDVPTKIYPDLENAFLNLINNSGHPSIKLEKTIDFNKLYNERFN